MFLMAALAGCSWPPEAAAADPKPVVEVVDLADVAESAVEGVVSITTLRSMADRRGRMGAVPQGLGSGVLIDREGVIVTNHHVIQDADRVEVTLHDGRVLGAKVVGSDPRTDVAVLRLDEVPADLRPLRWGDSDTLRLGETVLAIGNPFGIGHTLTRGIVSAKGRATLGVAEYEDFIQTDAAINPGNSGGALVDTRGELVGIPTAIFSRSGGYQGIGLAIPSKMARTLAMDLLEDGQIDRGWLGVAIAPTPEGVLLEGVSAEGAAAAAGLLAGDVITAFNGQPVTDLATFRSSVALTGAGERFDMSVLREGEKRRVRGTLGRRPDDPVAAVE
jgi:serine protease Do